MPSRPVVTAMFIGAGVLVVGAFVFLRAPETEGLNDVAGGGYGGIVPALCQARDNARTDSGEARTVWLDEAHVPLHSLADEVAASDRGAAAELLEAKQAVEADLEEEVVDANDLERDLDALIGATIAAAEVVDVEVEPCA